MTEAYWEKYRSTVDRQIEQSGLADGLGDNPYKGKPMSDAGRAYRENWWVDEYVRREGATSDTLLPPSLRLRREIEEIDRAAAALRSEGEVRALVEDLDARIAAWRRNPTPPHVSLSTVDADAVVARWRAAGGERDRHRPPEPPADPPQQRERRGIRALAARLRRRTGRR